MSYVTRVDLTSTQGSARAMSRWLCTPDEPREWTRDLIGARDRHMGKGERRRTRKYRRVRRIGPKRKESGVGRVLCRGTLRNEPAFPETNVTDAWTGMPRVHARSPLWCNRDR